MDKMNGFSRRSFLQKFSAATVGVSFTSSVIQKLFSADINTITNMYAGEKKFVPVMVTSFTATRNIDYKALSKLIDFYMASGVKGFFANCLSSEMYDLNNEERLALVEHVVKHVNGAVPVVATGSFGESINEQVEFAKKMYQTGVNGVILITSHFAAKDESDEILIKNLDKFFSLTGDIPMGTYECPSPYKRIITPEVLRFLLSTNRVIYHKDTCLDLEQIKVKLEIAKGSRLEFYDAHTPNAMYSLQMGAEGLSTIAGNFYPDIFVWVCNNVNNPDRQEDVKWLQSELTRVDEIISGYPLSAKYFLKKRGVPMELVCRKTKTPLTKEQVDITDGIFNTMLGWQERLGISTVKG
jgi:4-hydroxy-tetrahydrodipicolinate synthase